MVANFASRSRRPTRTRRLAKALIAAPSCPFNARVDFSISARPTNVSYREEQRTTYVQSEFFGFCLQSRHWLTQGSYAASRRTGQEPAKASILPGEPQSASRVPE